MYRFTAYLAMAFVSAAALAQPPAGDGAVAQGRQYEARARSGEERQPVAMEPQAQAAQYQETRRQMIPVNPDQLKDFFVLYNDMERASADALPTMRSRMVDVPLDPTAGAVRVHISPAMMTSMTVVDVTGAPWPITTLGAGDPGSFKVEDPEGYELHNLVQVSPLRRVGRTNVQFTLKGQSLPVSVLVVVDGKTTDDRVVLRIKGRGPNAHLPIVGEREHPVAESAITRTLDGLKPTASAVRVPAPNLVVWMAGNSLYVRTAPTEAVYSPYTTVQRGLNGYRAYRLPLQESLMIARDGEVAVIDLDISSARLMAMGGSNAEHSSQ